MAYIGFTASFLRFRVYWEGQATCYAVTQWGELRLLTRPFAHYHLDPEHDRGHSPPQNPKGPCSYMVDTWASR